MEFVLHEVPSVPPSASGASSAGGGGSSGDWKVYFARPGLSAALKMLAGLCRAHALAQTLLSQRGLLEPLHWMEGTSTSGEVGMCVCVCVQGYLAA